MTRTPTPAEIETLRRKAKRHDLDCVRSASEPYCGCGADEALAILDRLSPPAPEVDEATRIWREMKAKGAETLDSRKAAADYRAGRYIVMPWMDAEIAYLRTALSELIASKDAEIAEWKLASEEARSHWDSAVHEWNKTESELAALRAEIERLKADNMPPEGYTNLYIAARDCIFDANKLGRIEDGWLLLENVNVLVTSKAAERNTAEPAPFNRPTDPPEEVWNEFVPPVTDTAPVAEVTQADRDAAADLLESGPETYEWDEGIAP